MPERFNYGNAASNVVATIAIITRRVLQISQKVKWVKFWEIASILMLSCWIVTKDLRDKHHYRVVNSCCPLCGCVHIQKLLLNALYYFLPSSNILWLVKWQVYQKCLHMTASFGNIFNLSYSSCEHCYNWFWFEFVSNKQTVIQLLHPHQG